MGWQGRAAIRSRAVLLLALFVVSVAAKSTDQTQGDAEDAVPESTKKVTLAEEEKKVAFAREQELKIIPVASRTEDALLLAGGKLHTYRTKLDDTLAQQQKWRAAAAATERLVKKAQQGRAHAALTVSDDEDTLKRATQLVESARKEYEREVKERADSEMEEGRGIAMQQPSGVLLADSKRLNAQSNLVLKHSKSTQAKALAALDLKMAQQLADRASSGMVAAKGYFSRAIHARKEATAAAEAAAADTVNAATVSLTMAHDSPRLHHIENGEEQGPAALQDIVAADAKQVDAAEGALGAARQTLAQDQARARKLSAEVWQAQRKVDMLRKELRVSQGEVLAAAKAHVRATDDLQAVSARVLAASSAVVDVRANEEATLKQQLHDAQQARLRAAGHYERTNEKMEGINGERTMLEVKVERLKLRLKEALLQRDKALRSSHVSHTLVHKLERSLDEEGQSLKVARLRLAQEGLYSSSEGAGSSAGTGGGEGGMEVRGRRGRRGRKGYSALAASFLPKEHFDAHTGDLHDALAHGHAGHAGHAGTDLHAALAHQREQQHHIRTQQMVAVRSAKEEADSVQKAQLQVQEQLDRVERLEKSLKY